MFLLFENVKVRKLLDVARAGHSRQLANPITSKHANATMLQGKNALCGHIDSLKVLIYDKLFFLNYTLQLLQTLILKDFLFFPE